MNLQKHVKSPMEEWMLADASPVPTRARSPHVVGHYIRDRKLRYQGSRRDVPMPAPVLIRLDGLPTDLATRNRIERLIRDMNHQCRLARAPLNVRIL